MSEPQHPYGTDMNAGRPAPGEAPSAARTAPDSVAAVGARLAQLRESKGWTIEDVSARLKVAVHKLRALEGGDLGPLPDTTFALGVVRSYAKMLGADPAPLTEVLRRERGLSQPDLSMPASSGTDLPRGKVSLSLGSSGGTRRRSWLWGVAAVIVAVIALGMWHTNGGESGAWLARLKGIAGGDAGTSQGAQGASGADVAGGQTTGAEQSGAVAQSGESSANPSTAATTAAPASGEAERQAQAGAAPTGTVAPQQGQTPAQAAQAAPTPASPVVVAGAQPAATPAADGQSTFGIRATQDTWVSVRQSDGKEVFSGLIHGSDARDIVGVAPLRITVGNRAGVASMTFNGQPVDAAKYASAKGNVARFVLP